MELANQTLNEALGGVTNGQIEIAKEVLQNVYDNLAPSSSPEGGVTCSLTPLFDVFVFFEADTAGLDCALVSPPSGELEGAL